MPGWRNREMSTFSTCSHWWCRRWNKVSLPLVLFTLRHNVVTNTSFTSSSSSVMTCHLLSLIFIYSVKNCKIKVEGCHNWDKTRGKSCNTCTNLAALISIILQLTAIQGVPSNRWIFIVCQWSPASERAKRPPVERLTDDCWGKTRVDCSTARLTDRQASRSWRRPFPCKFYCSSLLQVVILAACKF